MGEGEAVDEDGEAEERLQRLRWTVGRNKMLSGPEQQKLVVKASQLAKASGTKSTPKIENPE